MNLVSEPRFSKLLYFILGPVSQTILKKGLPLVMEGHFISFGKATYNIRFTKPP